MKNQKFFFSVVAVLVVLGVFFLFFFGVVKPQFVGHVGSIQSVMQQSLLAGVTNNDVVTDTVEMAKDHVERRDLGYGLVRTVTYKVHNSVSVLSRVTVKDVGGVDIHYVVI